MMSGVTAQSTTTQLAGQVPKEGAKKTGDTKSVSSDLPGTFPETPANEPSEFSVNPIPATSGPGNPVNLQPGEKVPDPSTLTSSTVSSTVKDDPSLAKSENTSNAFGVTPLPATSGIGNPINLQPGESVPDPSSFTQNTIDSHVTTDKDSYEKSSGAPQLPNVVTPQNDGDAKGGSVFNVPEISKNMIPESGLPMGESTQAEKDPGIFIQSTGPGTTTAQLAGNVPKENSRTTQMGQNEAGIDGGADSSQAAAVGKSDEGKDIEDQAPQAPSASEGAGGKAAGLVAGAGAGAVGAAAAAGVTSHGLPDSVQQSIDQMNKGSGIAPTVPDTVQKSIADSHVSPEAAGDTTMVAEKKAMESELLSGVEPEQGAGQPAPTTSAALAETAPAATTTETPAAAAADPVSTDSPTTPTASKGAKSFPTKSSAPAPTSFEPAPSSNQLVTSAAGPALTPAPETATQGSSDYSREVSPMTKPLQQSKPAVTTGVGSSSAPETSQGTSSKAAPSPTSATSASTDKKDKRRSFFGKLKAKFSDKDKK